MTTPTIPDVSARPDAVRRARPGTLAAGRTVVAGVRDTVSAAATVDHAAAEAALRGWPLLIVHARPRPMTVRGRSAARARGAALLDRLSVRAHGAGVPVSTRLVLGDPVSGLLDAAGLDDLLVVEPGRAPAGATCDRVAARHRGVVLVVRAPGRPAAESPARPVVAGYDGSPWSERAVRFALEEARRRGSELLVLWSLPPSASRIEARRRASLLHAEAQRAGVPTRLRPADGGGRQCLLLESAHASALVVGARGTGALTGPLLGSTSRALIHEAHCPVFVVH